MIIRKTILYCTYINDIYTDTFISLILLKYKKSNLQNNYLHMYIIYPIGVQKGGPSYSPAIYTMDIAYNIDIPLYIFDRYITGI